MAHVYTATVSWERGTQAYVDRKYSRAHLWSFDGGVEVPASASPLVVKLPLSREDAVDPEEALVAATASCHMLFFLDLASRKGFRVDAYQDVAQGTLGKRADGRDAMVEIVLKPAITFSGEKRPSAADLDELHEQAHKLCYIANSLNFPVRHEPLPVEFV